MGKGFTHDIKTMLLKKNNSLTDHSGFWDGCFFKGPRLSGERLSVSFPKQLNKKTKSTKTSIKVIWVFFKIVDFKNLEILTTNGHFLYDFEI